MQRSLREAARQAYQVECERLERIRRQREAREQRRRIALTRVLIYKQLKWRAGKAPIEDGYVVLDGIGFTVYPLNDEPCLYAAERCPGCGKWIQSPDPIRDRFDLGQWLESKPIGRHVGAHHPSEPC